MPELHVLGVRHHSPACARLVEHTIAEVRPDYVLIEGPVEMNGRLDELALPHRLPIAVYSFAHGDALHHASWAPFCAYSPEWVALGAGRKVRAETLFIDLPAWDLAFLDVANRYGDRHSRASRRLLALCARLGVEDTDALWDHLFEQPLPPSELRERLSIYFRELREDDEAHGRDVTREAYMSRWIAWAMAQAKRAVVVVCGGYHAPALERAPLANPEKAPDRPEIPAREAAKETGSYLVPYSFHRLDSFVGYESGMPSPQFYQRVWEDGAAVAGEDMLFDAIAHLRKKKQRVSAADAIAALTAARGLAMLRGHQELARVDVLDGLASAVVKDALDAPLPWNRRGTLRRGTDPMLVAIVAAFSGERMGRLAKGTPLPPLVDDAFTELDRVGVVLDAKPSELNVVLTEPTGLETSRVLHRLRVLGIAGFRLARGPSFARDRTELSERWMVSRELDAEAALIEASAWGASLEAAAAAKLESAIGDARGMAALARLLREAALVGIGSLAGRLADAIAIAASTETSFAELGAGLEESVALFEHDVLLGARDAPLVGTAIVAAFDRGLWLFEAVAGDAGEDVVRGVLAMKDALSRCETKLGLDRGHAEAVMHRRAADASAPPAARGAAFGFVWSGEDTMLANAVKSAGRPETLGDFLSGLFALAREEIVRAPGLVPVIDALVGPMTREDFLIAIPSLRMAFAWFPPREKEAIARLALGLHGGDVADPRALLRPEVSADITLRGVELDAAVDALARRFAL